MNFKSQPFLKKNPTQEGKSLVENASIGGNQSKDQMVAFEKQSQLGNQDISFRDQVTEVTSSSMNRNNSQSPNPEQQKFDSFNEENKGQNQEDSKLLNAPLTKQLLMDPKIDI